MAEYTIIRKCSTLCTMHEPCSISESGLCAQNNKRPVDYDALAAEIFSGADVDYNGNLTISELTKRLAKVLP